MLATRTVGLSATILAGIMLTVGEVLSACRPSEFQCSTGACVALDRYCDGLDDCPDRSDEPKYCTPCNRTYFGDIGRTYEMEVKRPREDRLPFLCLLNFTAGSGRFGDLVQLTFDSFTVGKFVSFTSAGCPDGHMSIKELDRPATGGRWCGSAWGYTVYYSETASINLTLQLDHLSQQGMGYNFDFKISYKFLRKDEAKLRYGNATVTTWRGALQPNSYCDRVLEDCSRRLCRIQSPNYPGVYPRNVTCRYQIRETRTPPGKHALLAVRQTDSHKVHIKDQVVKYDRSQRVLRVWDQCNVVQDFLTVYDGGSTSAPELARLCGGDSVPDIVSSGPEMLLEFCTSPFDNPFHPVPLSYLPGFELEIQVLFVDADSSKYIKTEDKCNFVISSQKSPSGLLENPVNSLPPNTTCRYRFQGRPHDVVWLSFIKYHSVNADPAGYDLSECNAHMRLWDGWLEDKRTDSTKILGEFCKDEVPRLCDHTLLSNKTRSTRPCTPSESYISTLPDMTIEYFVRQGSALYPASFMLRYEFVDMSQEGNQNANSANPCDRVFKGTAGKFGSPRSTFLFGRGGRPSLTCLYRFEAPANQRLRLTFNKMAFGNKACRSRRDDKSGRWRCDRHRRSASSAPGVAQIEISEHPWPGVRLPRDCLCSNSTEPLVISMLSAQVVEVNFTITRMNITQDFTDFYFEAEQEFTPFDGDPLCSTTWGDRRLKGSSGEIALHDPSIPSPAFSSASSSSSLTNCVHQPWLIEPEDPINSYLYLKVHGFEISNSRDVSCPTTNRILVHSAGDVSRSKTICPELKTTSPAADGDEVREVVEVFSDGWNGPRATARMLEEEHARSFVVEFIQKEPGNYLLTWMEVFKGPLSASSSSTSSSSSSYVVVTGASDCLYRCPELNACISSSLWCDGFRHCPSGFDELEENCALRLGLSPFYAAISAVCLALVAFLAFLVGCYRCCSRRRRGHRAKALPPDFAAGSLPRGFHSHHHHHHHHHPDVYLHAKDSFC